jgi:hypothetical protein
MVLKGEMSLVGMTACLEGNLAPARLPDGSVRTTKKPSRYREGFFVAL